MFSLIIECVLGEENAAHEREREREIHKSDREGGRQQRGGMQRGKRWGRDTRAGRRQHWHVRALFRTCVRYLATHAARTVYI